MSQGLRRDLVRARRFKKIMENFSNAAFSPEVVEAMSVALESAVATLPEPVSSALVNSLAESILRHANGGERSPAALQWLALLELQLTKR
jgi:hypothetical protein